jgi:protein arginine N-methyltransferase 1
VLKANRAKNCHLIPCHSTEFDDRLAADVIVSETLGNYALEENIIATLADARARFLKPGGTIIPSRIMQYVAPVTAGRIDEDLRAWQRVGHGLDLTPAQVMTLNNVYVRLLQPSELLENGTTAIVWDTVDLQRETRAKRKGQAEWRLAKPATVYGFAVWWTADLGSGISLSTGPSAPRTHWEQLYFPLLAPIKAKAREQVAVELRSSSSEDAGTHLAWTAIHRNAGDAVISRQAHDLNKGYLP